VEGRQAAQTHTELGLALVRWVEQASTSKYQLTLMAVQASIENLQGMPMAAQESISMTVGVLLVGQAGCWFWLVPKAPQGTWGVARAVGREPALKRPLSLEVPHCANLTMRACALLEDIGVDLEQAAETREASAEALDASEEALDASEETLDAFGEMQPSVEARPCKVLPPLEEAHSSEEDPVEDPAACVVVLLLEAEACSDLKLSLAWWLQAVRRRSRSAPAQEPLA